MTPETEQATRFPARRLAIMAGLVLAVVAVPLVAGFLLLREGGSADDALRTEAAGADDPQQAGRAAPDDAQPTATAITEDTQSTRTGLCDIYGFDSLEKLVSEMLASHSPFLPHVVLARVDGGPEVWLTDGFGNEIPESEVPDDPRAPVFEHITVDVTVLEYFLDEGPSAMRVTQSSAGIYRSSDGTIQRALTSGCGYVELTQGKTYVLFLQHLEGHPQGEAWMPIGIPAAFEVDGQEVLATEDVYVTPADFCWSTLADVRRDAEAVKAGLAAGQTVLSDIHGFHSLEKLVSDFPGRADVVLARVEGDPEVRLTEINGGGPVDPNDFERAIERISVGATVLEYFLGEGPSAMRVEQTSAILKKRPDGTTYRASGSGCGYVELTQGKTYVLFLERFEGHPLGDDLWGPIGVPSAFEVDGQDVVATDDAHVTPADFGWSTLADVRRDAEAVKASLAAGQ